MKACPYCAASIEDVVPICPHCQRHLPVASRPVSNDVALRRTIEMSTVRPGEARTEPAVAITRVTVVDIDMPFMSMVNFMIKWAIAAIPAFFAIVFAWLLIVRLLSAVLGFSY